MGQEMVPRKAMPGNPANPGEASGLAPAAAAAQTQAAAQVSQQAPLNPANLEKHTQALNKMHQRSNSKSGQAPAAPTTTQPPFQFGAQKSSTGQPTYFNKPAVTQETLIPPPPARKKAKTGPQQASSPAIQQSGPSSQVKAVSPEVKRQAQAEQAPKAPPKPLLVCPNTSCGMHSTGFASKEALDAHVYEEHVKPAENPMQYMQDTLKEALGLDTHDRRIPKGGATDVTQSSPPAMKLSASKQGQTLAKQEMVSTPMSRDASMRRQGSAPGVKADSGAQIKLENTPKSTMADRSQAAAAEDPWANSTVNPQQLQATFAPLVPFINGQLSHFSPHWSRTSTETPESSKESENSDISESAALEIDFKWQPVDLDHDLLLMDMDAFSMNGKMLTDHEFAPLDELDSEFAKYDHDKPFEMDMSLYHMYSS